MDLTEARTLLAQRGWLSGEKPQFRDAVLATSTLRRYDAGEFAFHADDEPGGLFGLVDGSFGVLIPADGDRLALVHVLHESVWFGHGPALTGRRRTLTFRAIEASHVLYLPLPRLADLGSHLPELKSRIAALSEMNFTIAIRTIGDLLIRSGAQRVAATLLRAAGFPDEGVGGPPWPIRLSQSEIGEMANVSRDRVNRTLADFQRRDWISQRYREIVVVDGEALRRYAFRR
ncbi:MAG: Crp/Fnr family transcriptional regulator [Hyphomicrobiales bacterium]